MHREVGKAPFREKTTIKGGKCQVGYGSSQVNLSRPLEKTFPVLLVSSVGVLCMEMSPAEQVGILNEIALPLSTTERVLRSERILRRRSDVTQS